MHGVTRRLSTTIFLIIGVVFLPGALVLLVGLFGYKVQIHDGEIDFKGAVDFDQSGFARNWLSYSGVAWHSDNKQTVVSDSEACVVPIRYYLPLVSSSFAETNVICNVSIEGKTKKIPLPSNAYGRSSINLSVFRKNSLITIDDTLQVVGYFGANGEIRLDVRSWNTNSLVSSTVFTNPMSARMLGDGHQGINIGYSGDGYLHLIWGAHGTQPFYYKLSWPALKIIDSDVDRLDLTSARISYPQFYQLEGQLILLYRDDVLKSYSINKYEAGKWRKWLAPILEIPHNLNSIYLNVLGINGGTIALAYTLRRPSPDDPTVVLNEDIRVIYTLDSGATWYGSDGVTLSAPIHATDPPPTIRIAANRNLMNQSGAWLDKNNKFYISYYHDDEEGIPQVYVTVFDLQTKALETFQLTNRTEDFSLSGGRGTLSLPISRPIIFHIENDVVLIYREGNEIITFQRRILHDNEPWSCSIVFTGAIQNWEPQIDYSVLGDNQISLYIQAAQQGDADRNFPLCVSSPALMIDIESANLPFSVNER